MSMDKCVICDNLCDTDYPGVYAVNEFICQECIENSSDDVITYLVDIIEKQDNELFIAKRSLLETSRIRADN